MTVIPTAIPAPPYVLSRPPEIKQEFGLPPDARLLLYVGRLAPEKNLDLLLRAFALISAQTSDTYLILAGSGKSRGALEARARSLGIHRRTRFAGFLGRTKLDPLYQASDLFLFPSKTETQGLAVGEALASGLPCVVVNAGGAPESVRDGVDGILVEDDAAQMARTRTAGRLLADPRLRRARTPESVGGRMVAVYEDCGAKARQRQGKPAPPKASAASTQNLMVIELCTMLELIAARQMIPNVGHGRAAFLPTCPPLISKGRARDIVPFDPIGGAEGVPASIE